MSAAYNEYLEAIKDSKLYKANHKNDFKIKSLAIKIFALIFILSLISFTWKFISNNSLYLSSTVDKSLIYTNNEITNNQTSTLILKKEKTVTAKKPIQKKKTLEERFREELKLIN